MNLKKYDLRNLEEATSIHATSGSFGKFRIYYDKELKIHVVAKFFFAYGEQLKFEKLYSDFERETNIHAQFKHINIVRILGTLLRDNRSFALILEYAPCGDLENLLHFRKEIPLPWKLRARFFTELSDALDYLHNHNPKRRYIHGDLKPQSVLLGHKLEVKLTDFGSTLIDNLADSSSLSVTPESSTQRSLFYTAPEYLKNITKGSRSSMDVYSYGMIGYEILTRKHVYFGANASTDVIIHFIMMQGLKPDACLTVEVENSLAENSNESAIFRELLLLVKQCWQTNPKDRLKIFAVKQRLIALAQDKQIYDKSSDAEVKTLAEEVTLHPLNFEKQTRTSLTTKLSVVLVLFVAFFVSVEFVILFSIKKISR